MVGFKMDAFFYKLLLVLIVLAIDACEIKNRIKGQPLLPSISKTYYVIFMIIIVAGMYFYYIYPFGMILLLLVRLKLRKKSIFSTLIILGIWLFVINSNLVALKTLRAMYDKIDKDLYRYSYANTDNPDMVILRLNELIQDVDQDLDYSGDNIVATYKKDISIFNSSLRYEFNRRDHVVTMYKCIDMYCEKISQFVPYATVSEQKKAIELYDKAKIAQ